MLSLERYKKILGKNFDSVSKCFVASQKSIRTNTIKVPTEVLEKKLENKGWKIEKLPFYVNGFFLTSNDNPSKSIEHSLGYYFVQNASSMIPPLVLDPQKGEIILDIAASPGAKTTQIAMMMENRGVIIANDVRYERLKALRGNIQRCGVLNAVVTKMWGETYHNSGMKFDKILVDAPCSATGLFSPRILKTTSERSLKILGNIQKRILYSASKMLNEDGTLVYSTCSLEPEENEENIEFAEKKLNLNPEEIKIKGLDFEHGLNEWNNSKFKTETSLSVRIVPTEKMEGFFICKMSKY